MKNLDWVRTLSEEQIEAGLSGDLRLVYEQCGLEAVIALLTGMPMVWIYVPKMEAAVVDGTPVLTGDMELVRKRCGMETVSALLAGTPGIYLLVSCQTLSNWQKAYICQAFSGDNAKTLALELGISQRQVYAAMTEMRREKQEQAREADLFNSQDH